MITRLQESPFLREFGDIVVKKENNIFNNNFFSIFFFLTHAWKNFLIMVNENIVIPKWNLWFIVNVTIKVVGILTI